MGYAKVLHPRSADRTEALNDNYSSVPFNEGRVNAAKEEVQTPIINIIQSVRKSVWGLLKGAKNLAADLVTNPVAFAANTGRWAWDVATKLPSRAALIFSDYFGEKTFGKVSKAAGKVNARIHEIWSGDEHGGHGGHDAHGGHGGHDAHGGGHDAHGGHGHGPRELLEIKTAVQNGEKLGGGHGHH